MKNDGQKSQVKWCKARQIFASFYIEHCTLLQFLRKIDQSEESDLILQHGDHPDYQYLLKTTITAIPGPEQASKWPAFKPRYTQWRTLCEIIHRVIENACRSTTSINVLAYGYGPLSGYNRYGTVAGTSGIQNSYPNTIVSYLRTAKPWQILHQRVGDDLMIHLLQNIALFIKMPSSKCYLQVAGHPISRLIPLSVDASPQISGSDSSAASSDQAIIGETGAAKRKTRRGGKRYQRFRQKAGTSAMDNHAVTFGNVVKAEVDMEGANSDVCSCHGVAKKTETGRVLSQIPQRWSTGLLPMEMTESSRTIISEDKTVAKCRACIQESVGMETMALRSKLRTRKTRKRKFGKECEKNSEVWPRGKPWIELAQFLPQPCLCKTVENLSDCRTHERKTQTSKSKEPAVNDTRIQIPLNEIYLPHSRLFYASNLSQKFPKNHVMEFASVSGSGARKLIQDIFLTKGPFGAKANSSVEKVRQEKVDQNAEDGKRVEVSAKGAHSVQKFCSSSKKRHFRLPRRLIQMQPLFIKLLARHKKCPFQTLLRHHCFYYKRGVRVLKSKNLKRAIVLRSKRKLCKKSLQKRQKGLLCQMTNGVNFGVYHHAVNNYTSHSQVFKDL